MSQFSLSNLPYFQFEADFTESLRCIPMIVRMKLDTCGVKLKLHHWNLLDTTERLTLVEMPCETEAEAAAYRQWLQSLITKKTGKPAGELAVSPHSPWLNDTVIPDAVTAKARELKIDLHLHQWQKLTPLQRFALIKLSRPSHENQNFLPALKEFNLT
ncbi:nitrate reductase associated protein [Myxosarcina sp. GI1]|uniref:nitrate reductase associated protein n=1 Tax=Myxosarcina sp. GI1 TaxID=1541065 RepID=UPI00055DA06E|nr:nitrate reductase associated protein [Myxosarcina sp. GI1]